LDVDEFIKLLKANINELFEEGIISGIKKLDLLEFSEYTYLWNVALYLTIKQYRARFDSDLYLVPEEGGRFPSDFAIKNKDGKVELLIEHENDENEILKNYNKLMNRDATCRLLICYVGDKTPINKKVDELIQYRNTKGYPDKKVHLLIATKGDKKNFELADEFVYRFI